MKNIITSIALCLGFMLINAQTLSVKVGPTFSKLDWTNSISSNTIYNKNYTGFIAAVRIDYLEKKFFFVSSSVGFVQNGGRGSVPVYSLSNPSSEPIYYKKIKTSFNNLSMNTLLNFKVRIAKRFIPFIGAGPRFDYLINYDDNSNIITQFDNFHELKRAQIGVMGVAGLKYQQKRFVFGLQFEYHYVFNKLVNFTSAQHIKNEFKIKYYVFAATLGIKIKK